MVQSLNTKVDLTVKATSYLGLANYGEVMVGDKAFEFYNEKNIRDYIHKYIPSENLVRSLSFFQVIKRGLKSLFRKKSRQ